VHEEVLVQIPDKNWPVGAVGFGVGSIDHPGLEAVAVRANEVLAP
jgi:hypothetical protein